MQGNRGPAQAEDVALAADMNNVVLTGPPGCGKRLDGGNRIAGRFSEVNSFVLDIETWRPVLPEGKFPPDRLPGERRSWPRSTRPSVMPFSPT
jgi:hypothetical protein